MVFEAVGTPAAFERALDVVRRGGRVVVVGMYAGETVAAQLGVWWSRALDVRFPGICPVHAWWERRSPSSSSGSIDPSPIVSHRLPLEDAARGYELFDSSRGDEGVLLP